MARIEELTDLSSDEADEMLEDYKSIDVTAQKIKQADGKWTVRATFPTFANPRDKDDLDCCGHKLRDTDAIADEDLPVAVGGVE